MRKKALGRGLSELIPELEEEVSLSPEPGDLKNRGISYIPVESVLFSPFQPRTSFKEDTSFEELVNSIKEKGVLQPIIVRKVEEGLYECVAGERRLRAVKKLGLKTIPAIVKNFTDEEVLITALIENIQRKDLNPLEEALAYKKLIEKFNYTQEKIAEKTGRDRSTVANLLRLLNLPENIQQDILEGKISVGHGKALLSLNNQELQLKVRNLILEKGLSVRETEKLVARILKDGLEAQDSKKSQPDPDLALLSEEISKIIGTRVEIKKRGKKTRIVFEFSELERAEEFIEILKKSFSE
jgi:ParB family chromosome partitioning protein